MAKSMFVSGSLHRISGQISEASARMHQHNQEQDSPESGNDPQEQQPQPKLRAPEVDNAARNALLKPRYEELLRTKRDLIGQLNEAEAKSSAEQMRLERSAADCAQTLAELRAILARLESCRIPELSDSDFHPALNEALRTFENGRIELIRATALPSEHAAGTAVQTAAKMDLADIPAGTLFKKGFAFFLPLILTILFSAFVLALSFIIAWKVAL